MVREQTRHSRTIINNGGVKAPIIQSMNRRRKVRVRQVLRKSKAVLNNLASGAAYALKN
jgi:hypothetical protein